MNDHLKGLLITTLGVLFVVPDALFIRLIDAGPIVIAFWRGVIVAFLLAVGILVRQGTAPFAAVMGTGRYGIIYVITLGVSGYLFTLAVSLTSVANVVFIIASMPVFAAIYSRIFLSEPISRRMVLTMCGVAVGLAVIAYGSGENENAWWGGDLLALGVSASFAAGLTAARRVKTVSMVPAVSIAYFGAGIVVLPFIDPFSIAPEQVWMVALHGCVIVVSAACLALGPRYVTSAEVALLILLESVFAPLLVWAVIGENPGGWALIGGGVVVGVLAFSNTIVLLRRRPQAAPCTDGLP